MGRVPVRKPLPGAPRFITLAGYVVILAVAAGLLSAS